MRAFAAGPGVLLTAVAAGLAVALLVPGAGARPRDRTPRGADVAPRGRARGPGVAGAVVVGAGAAVLLVALDGTRLLLGLVVLAAAAGAGVLVRRGRRARRARERRAAVVDVCEALAGELRAGQPLVAALVHGREVWADLAPVVAAARLGADVPGALRHLAGSDGAEGLAEVAAAWQVAERSGAGLASALDRVARTARARQATRHLVQGELASAQATARLVALLPLVSLAMSAGVGGDPWHFLLATPAGLACLGLGLLFAFAGLLWIDRIAARVLRS